MTIKTILFDLDGTLLDTNELIIASFLHALEGMTAQPLTRETVIANMGRPLIEQMRQYTGSDDVEAVVAKYRAYNVGRHDELVREFPRVREVLAELRSAGVRIGVVTSKVRRTTLMGLKLCGLESYVETIVTVQDVSQPKPDPEGIRLAMRTLAADAETTLMVGDSHYDIEAARGAGVRSVAVAWSLKGEAYLREARPDYIVHDMRELLGLALAARDVH